MGRLKLFGEPEGGGTDDHSALSNLDYAQSGHIGFVPSQGEAIIDILRLNQNLIRDSDGNDRLHLAASSPHLTLTGSQKISGGLGVLGNDPLDYWGVIARGTMAGSTVGGGYFEATSNQPTGIFAIVYGLFGYGKYQGSANYGGITGLDFRALSDTTSPVYSLMGINANISSQTGATGAITTATGINVGGAWYSAKPSTLYGINIVYLGASGVGTLYGLHIADQTATAVRLLELGPTTPYLRLLGGGDPPADKSNLYLKFGSTLYRLVKSGDYIALEAP